MRKTLYPWLLLLFFDATVAAQISVVDALNRTVTLQEPAQRIIALAPHAVENLFSAGAGDKLIGVVSYSNYPSAARLIPEVGSYQAFSREAILALRPDLIVMWASGNGISTLEDMQVLGVPIYVTEPRRLADIPRAIRNYAVLAGTTSVGNVEAARIEREFAELRQRYSHKTPLSLFYQIWHQPLQTLNGEHLISKVMRLCGGRNAFADAASLAPKINLESVLLRDPDVILASGMDIARPQWLDAWRKYPALKAVRNNNLFFIPPDHLQRPTARVLLGARTLCQQLELARHK